MILHLNPLPWSLKIRQLLTSYGVLYVWYKWFQGTSICKWALCSLSLQELDHYTADTPMWQAFGLCQHNFWSNEWKLETQGQRGTCATFTLFFHANPLWSLNLSDRLWSLTGKKFRQWQFVPQWLYSFLSSTLLLLKHHLTGWSGKPPYHFYTSGFLPKSY